MGAPINQARQVAIEMGLPEYEGRPHRNCGRTLRYTSGGGCVHCARIIADEQRAARKYLQLHPPEPKPEPVPDDVELDVDNRADDDIDSEEAAAARREEELDELM